MFVITKQKLLDINAAYFTTLGGHAISVRLYQTAVTPSIDSVIADFTEADYTGYAAVLMTGQNDPYWQTQGVAASWLIPPAVFQPTGTTVTNVIYGYYVTEAGTPATLLGAEAFPSPVAMASSSDQIIVAAVLGIADGKIPGNVY